MRLPRWSRSTNYSVGYSFFNVCWKLSCTKGHIISSLSLFKIFLAKNVRHRQHILEENPSPVACTGRLLHPKHVGYVQKFLNYKCLKIPLKLYYTMYIRVTSKSGFVATPSRVDPPLTVTLHELFSGWFVSNQPICSQCEWPPANSHHLGRGKQIFWSEYKGIPLNIVTAQHVEQRKSTNVKPPFRQEVAQSLGETEGK